jgi:hypothetical protein
VSKFVNSDTCSRPTTPCPTTGAPGICRGGVLADEMGLGKTLQVRRHDIFV